jgi:predicted MFS family arabinose efflux permease
MALQHTDWRGLFILLALLIAASAALIWLFAPRSAAPSGTRPPLFAAIVSVYRTPAFRRTISLVLLPHAVFFGIQGLWIGRFLSDVARFPDDAVAYLLYLGMAAVIFGAIAVGMITEWAGRRGITPLDVAGAGIAVFVLVQAAFVVGYKPSFQLLSVLFTLVGTVTGIEYAIVAQSMPRELTGRAATCLNLLIFVGAFLVQAGFGLVIGLWQPDGGAHYPAPAYQVAFGVLVLLQLPGLVGYARRRFAAGRAGPVAIEEARTPA